MLNTNLATKNLVVLRSRFTGKYISGGEEHVSRSDNEVFPSHAPRRSHLVISCRGGAVDISRIHGHLRNMVPYPYINISYVLFFFSAVPSPGIQEPFASCRGVSPNPSGAIESRPVRGLCCFETGLRVSRERGVGPARFFRRTKRGFHENPAG